MRRYLTTNDQEASRLLMPSTQLLMRLLSRISLANAEVVTTQAMVMQLYCALLAENVRTQDDVDDMQVFAASSLRFQCNSLVSGGWLY